jgi:anti-anti-sigma factor
LTTGNELAVNRRVTAGPLPPEAVASFRQMLVDVVEQARGDVVVDLAQTDQLDQRGAAVLVGAARRLAGRGGRLVLTGACSQVQRTLALNGLHRHLSTSDI